MKLSVRQQMMIILKVILTGGGTVAEFPGGTSTVWRHKKEKQKELCKDIISNYVVPEHIVVHHDSKLISYLTGKSDERLAICISGGENVKPQFIGAPKIEGATGKAMSKAVVSYLNDWGAKDNCVATVWDTTSSNTGKHIGAATLLEQELKHALLWIACRHHVAELHIEHTNIAIRGTFGGPVDPLFKKFKDQFDSLVVNNDELRKWQWPITDNFLHQQATEVLEWANQHMLSATFPREDYRELLELLVFYLGGAVKRPRENGTPHVGFHMRKPGAMHSARFMAQSIYLLKICMLSNQFILTPRQLASVTKLAEYIALFYARYFLRAMLAAAAPSDDLQFWYLMKKYREFQPHMADASLASIGRHLWYLTEELVVLSLWDSELSDQIREHIATTLAATACPDNFDIGKPKFPGPNRLRLVDGNKPNLAEFIGPRSWLLFHLLGQIPAEQVWLHHPRSDWAQSDNYISLLRFVKSLKVVNDCAERSIKDVTEFANASKDADQREYILHVVNSHRERIDLRKANKASLENL